MQKRKHSLVEKLVETFIAFLISLVAAPIFFMANGIETTTGQNLGVVALFTVLAIIRGYLIRRLFNWLHVTGRLS